MVANYFTRLGKACFFTRFLYRILLQDSLQTNKKSTDIMGMIQSLIQALVQTLNTLCTVASHFLAVPLYLRYVSSQAKEVCISTVHTQWMKTETS